MYYVSFIHSKMCPVRLYSLSFEKCWCRHVKSIFGTSPSPCPEPRALQRPVLPARPKAALGLLFVAIECFCLLWNFVSVESRWLYSSWLPSFSQHNAFWFTLGAHFSVLFLSRAGYSSMVWLHHILFIHLSADIWVCFQPCLKTILRTFVYKVRHMFFSSWGGIQERNRGAFHILRDGRTVLRSAFVILHSCREGMRSSCHLSSRSLALSLF